MDKLGVVVFILFALLLVGGCFIASVIITSLAALINKERKSFKVYLKLGLKTWAVISLISLIILLIISIVNNWW